MLLTCRRQAIYNHYNMGFHHFNTSSYNLYIIIQFKSTTNHQNHHKVLSTLSLPVYQIMYDVFKILNGKIFSKLSCQIHAADKEINIFNI